MFCYLDDKELALTNASDKILLAVNSVIDDMERERARQRTRDALLRKAKAGHVTGGTVFGYENVEKVENGHRQHVERQIHPEEAKVVVRIFNWAAEGHGCKAIAKRLNAEGAFAPKPRRKGRPRSWAESSVRVVLTNPIYRGEVIWGRRMKRDSWGAHNVQDRPESEWIKTHDENLRIVPDELWHAAQAARAGRRAVYHPRGHRPSIQVVNPGVRVKYLLSGGLAVCPFCEGPLIADSRDMGRRGRKEIYVCSRRRHRGDCPGVVIPLEIADAVVLEALKEDLLDPDVVEIAVEEALKILQEAPASAPDTLQTALATVESELKRYAEAVATAGPLPSLLTEIKTREDRRATLQQQIAAQQPVKRTPVLLPIRLKVALYEKLEAWKTLLVQQTTEARAMLTEVLVTPVTFRPVNGQPPVQPVRGRPKRSDQPPIYEFVAEGSLGRTFTGLLTRAGVVTPAGFEPAISTLKGSRPWPG